MNDATRRGLRTAGQLVITLVSNGALFGLLAVLGVDVTVEQFAAVSAVLLPIVTTAVNALEDRETIPALFAAKAPVARPHEVHTPVGVDGDATADPSLSQGHGYDGEDDEGPPEPGSVRLQ